MHLPLLQPISNADFFVSGDVVIDECAAIAPGVILQADAGSRITIAAGVCVGMGAILHAHKGNLEVEAGANIGAGVLVVGTGKIGANACIGACTTILNSDLTAMQVVPAGSVIGDNSRQEALNSTAEQNASVKTASPAEIDTPANSPESQDPTPAANQPDAIEAAPAAPAQSQAIIQSQRHLNRLMLTVFPHGQALNQNSQNGPSASQT